MASTTLVVKPYLSRVIDRRKPLSAPHGLLLAPSGLPSYPNPGMAAVVLGELTESLNLKFGVWDALGDRRAWGFSGNEVTFTIGELEYKYALFDGRLPGGLSVQPDIQYIASPSGIHRDAIAVGLRFQLTF